MTRYVLLAALLLIAALVTGCQSVVAPAPINATYDYAGPPTLGEAVNFEDTCLLPIEIGYAFSGDIEGVATSQAQILHDGLCEPDTQYCDYNEKWVAEGVYEGEVKGQAGTFDYFLTATVNDCHFDAQMAIEPGTGTGDLAGINGIIIFDEEPGDEPPWPVTGYVYYEPTQEASVAEAAAQIPEAPTLCPAWALCSRRTRNGHRRWGRAGSDNLVVSGAES